MKKERNVENKVPQSHLYNLVPQVFIWAFQSDWTAYSNEVKVQEYIINHQIDQSKDESGKKIDQYSTITEDALLCGVGQKSTYYLNKPERTKAN